MSSETGEIFDGRIKEIVCDEISALPDDMLLTILMCLSAKDAIATMILSKRWRFLWTMMPVLRFKESQDNDDDESQRSVWWLLDKSLQLHKAPVLVVLSMELGPRCPSDADVGKLVAKAVDRHVVWLKLDLLLSGDPKSLPKTLYSCETLHTLLLLHKIFVDVPSHAYLPSLKTLHLTSVMYKNDDSLIRFLASCPVLERLTVIREKNDNVKKFIVKVPYLLYFTYLNYCSKSDIEDTGRCLVIDTPALIELDISDYSGDSRSVESMPCIEHLCIEVDWVFLDVDKFLKSFSTVSFLELYLTEEMIKCCSTIKFSRLTKCVIFPIDSDWMDSLVPFLQNTPKLNFLIIDYEFTDRPPMASYSWRKFSSDLECLSSSLEKFELIHYGGRDEEQELVEYILTKSICLKTATISLRPTFLELEDKETRMDKLKAIPRSSITSQLLLKA